MSRTVNLSETTEQAITNAVDSAVERAVPRVVNGKVDAVRKDVTGLVAAVATLTERFSGFVKSHDADMLATANFRDEVRANIGDIKGSIGKLESADRELQEAQERQAAAAHRQADAVEAQQEIVDKVAPAVGLLSHTLTAIREKAGYIIAAGVFGSAYGLVQLIFG